MQFVKMAHLVAEVNSDFGPRFIADIPFFQNKLILKLYLTVPENPNLDELQPNKQKIPDHSAFPVFWKCCGQG